MHVKKLREIVLKHGLADTLHNISSICNDLSEEMIQSGGTGLASDFEDASEMISSLAADIEDEFPDLR